MRFTLRAESPIHVGSGETHTWLDWFAADGFVHVIDWSRLLDAVLAIRDDAAESLAAFTDRANDDLEAQKDQVANARGRERDELLRTLRERHSALRWLKDEIKDVALHDAVRSGTYDRRRAAFIGGRFDRRLEIRAHAVDANGTPTVPGTTLKGQLRSALAHAVLLRGDPDLAKVVLDGADDLDGWNRTLARATPGRARFRFGDEIEAAAFRVPNHRGPHRRLADRRFDVLRFLLVSDALKANATLEVVRVSPFNLARGGDGHITPLLPTVVEALVPGSEFEFELRVDARQLKRLAALPESGHPMLGAPLWTVLDRLFGLVRDDARMLDEPTIERRVLGAIEASLAARFQAIAAREKTWLDRMGAPKDAAQRMFVERLAGDVDRFALRVGIGAGLHGTTALLALERSSALAEPLARALARAGLGLTPQQRRERAEREKLVMERARQDGANASSRSPPLRDELKRETRDPKTIPVARRFTMEAGSPGQWLGFASLARGVIAADATPPEVQKRAPRPPRDDDHGPRDDRGPRRDGPRPPRGPSGDRGPRPPKPPRERRPELPDRPATGDELRKLMERFGPRRT